MHYNREMEKDFDTIEDKIFAAKVKLLFSHTKAAVPATILTALCIFFALYRITPLTNLIYWLALVVAVITLRHLSYELFSRNMTPQNSRFWHGIFALVTIIGSLIWITLSVYLMPSNPAYQVVIALIITSIAAISIPLFGASLFINCLFIILVLSSFVAKMFFYPDAPHQLIASYALIYMVVLMLSSYRINKEIYAMLKLQIEKEDLIKRLYSAKAEVESVNANLQTEMVEREQIEQLLRNSEEQYRLVTNALPVLIAYIDTELYFRFNNKVYEEWFKKPLDEITGMPVKDIFGDNVLATFNEHYDELLKGKQVAYETTMHFHEQHERYVSVTLIPHFNDNQFLGTFSLISDMTPRINYLATHDPLTNLPNRSLFNARLTHALRYASRHHSSLAILFLDLDHFKNVNDTFGHDVGDQLLIKVVERIKQIIDEKETLSRLGGDEFIIILENDTQMSRIKQVAQNICDALSNVFIIGDRDLYITTSIGISLFPNDGKTMQILLKNADMAMYRAKDRGRNIYEFYTSGMDEAMQRKSNIGMSMRSALDKNELKIYYQPILDMQTGKIICLEALLRWEHPEMGFVSPNEFIPIAEETDLIIPISEWVLRTASKQLLFWHRQGYDSLRLTVNVSSRQFMNRDVVESIRRILVETGLGGQYLIFELTESLLMHDIDHGIKVVQALKALDITIALDDFGTGYSSLSYLKRFPVDILKIDRSFVTNFSINHDDAAIVKTIITLGHHLQMRVVAEGVETPEQYVFLNQYGCDDVQGYLFYPPLSEVEMTLVLQQQMMIDTV